ncbi:acyltransferase family protein [Butyrivibrio sp. AE2032]|uniref:acyltransferase family protein n=1 Tax=Butyrivibrio sp. AE2032 TaxID=1458463 RepID=UPI00055558CF|nr:acyltransferase [Butyrivibrio sp. AE2032]
MQKALNSKALNGIKLFAILGMICYHSGLLKSIDYGAVACIFFFIVSGFTTAYRHIGSKDNNTEFALKYYNKKLKSLYFPYYVSFALSIPFVILEVKSLEDGFEALCNSFFHVFFIQSWFPNITYKFNAIAWFTSAMLFCYLLTPVLIVVLNRITSRKAVFSCLIITLLLHLFLEFCSIKYPDVFTYSMHSNPIIKCIEYVLGMMLAIYYKQLKASKEKNTIIYTVLEVLIILLDYVAARAVVLSGYKTVILIPLCLTVFLFSVGQGYVSRIISVNAIQKLAALQGFIYLFHYVAINYTRIMLTVIRHKKIYENKPVFSILCILTTILLSYIMTLIYSKISTRKK